MKLRHFRHPRRQRAPIITSIARLRLEPGDALVLHVRNEHRLGAYDLAKGLRAQLGCRVIVLSEGMRFGVIASSQLPKETP